MAIQATVAHQTTATSSTVRIRVAGGRRTKWPHDRATPASGFQRPAAHARPRPIGTRIGPHPRGGPWQPWTTVVLALTSASPRAVGRPRRPDR